MTSSQIIAVALSLLIGAFYPRVANAQNPAAVPAWRVRAMGELRDLRVFYVPLKGGDPRLDARRIAVLTDSENLARGKERSPLLQRKSKTERLEQDWRRTAVRGGIAEYLRARETKEKGGDLSGFSQTVRNYLANDWSLAGLEIFASLDDQGLNRLLEGEEVRLPRSVVPRERLQTMFRTASEVFAQASGTTAEEWVRGMEERTERHGLGLRLDLSGRIRDSYFLEVNTGPAGMGPRIVAAQLAEDDVGMPLTRTNPYKVMRSGNISRLPDTALPDWLRRATTVDLRLPETPNWVASLGQAASALGIEACSDDYRSREASRLSPDRAGRILAAKGTTVADALDQLCRTFGYVWWFEGTTCYFRAKNWPRDVEREVPETLFDAWRQALTRRRRISERELGLLANLNERRWNTLERLTSGEAPVNTAIHDEMRDFIRYLARLTPVQQRQIYEKGLIVNAGMTGDFNIPARLGATGHAILLRLEQETTRVERSGIRLSLVKFRLHIRFAPDKVDVRPFEIGIPDA